MQYGLAAMINAAETARIQGLDLHAEQATRIRAGIELHARYLDKSAGPPRCAGALNAGSLDPMWEVAVNSCEGRLGKLLPGATALPWRSAPAARTTTWTGRRFARTGVGSVGVP